MQFIDSHIHLQDYKSNNAPQIAAEMQQFGFIGAICPSTSDADWKNVLHLAKQYPDFVIPALGFHPWYISLAEAKWPDKLKNMLQQNPDCLIGECGLDKLKNPELESQKTVFATHVELASELSRPIIIHAVKADEWLQDFWNQLKNVKFVIHSFSGSVELLKQTLKKGGYISFSPAIIRKNNFAELAKYVPTPSLMLESDGPYQGEPKNILQLAEKIAKYKNIKIEELTQQVLKNTQEFIYV